MSFHSLLLALSSALALALVGGVADAQERTYQGKVDRDPRAAAGDPSVAVGPRIYQREVRPRYRGFHRGRFHYSPYGWRSPYFAPGHGVRIETIVTPDGFVRELFISRGHIVGSRIVGRRRGWRDWRHHGWHASPYHDGADTILGGAWQEPRGVPLQRDTDPMQSSPLADTPLLRGSPAGVRSGPVKGRVADYP